MIIIVIVIKNNLLHLSLLLLLLLLSLFRDKIGIVWLVYRLLLPLYYYIVIINTKERSKEQYNATTKN